MQGVYAEGKVWYSWGISNVIYLHICDSLIKITYTNFIHDTIIQFFFRKGYVDRVIPWLETFIEEIQDNVKVTDEELNNVNWTYKFISYRKFTHSLALIKTIVYETRAQTQTQTHKAKIHIMLAKIHAHFWLATPIMPTKYWDISGFSGPLSARLNFNQCACIAF